MLNIYTLNEEKKNIFCILLINSLIDFLHFQLLVKEMHKVCNPNVILWSSSLKCFPIRAEQYGYGETIFLIILTDIALVI